MRKLTLAICFSKSEQVLECVALCRTWSCWVALDLREALLQTVSDSAR